MTERPRVLHPLKIWGRTRRETGLVEHVCEHGVGHPNYGSALWLAEQQCLKPRIDGVPEDLERFRQSWLVHGCDGCCGRDDFPGTVEGSLRNAHEIIRTLQRKLREVCA